MTAALSHFTNQGGLNNCPVVGELSGAILHSYISDLNDSGIIPFYVWHCFVGFHCPPLLPFDVENSQEGNCKIRFCTPQLGCLGEWAWTWFRTSSTWVFCFLLKKGACRKWFSAVSMPESLGQGPCLWKQPNRKKTMWNLRLKEHPLHNLVTAACCLSRLFREICLPAAFSLSWQHFCLTLPLLWARDGVYLMTSCI